MRTYIPIPDVFLTTVQDIAAVINRVKVDLGVDGVFVSSDARPRKMGHVIDALRVATGAKELRDAVQYGGPFYSGIRQNLHEAWEAALDREICALAVGFLGNTASTFSLEVGHARARIAGDTASFHILERVFQKEARKSDVVLALHSKPARIHFIDVLVRRVSGF